MTSSKVSRRRESVKEDSHLVWNPLEKKGVAYIAQVLRMGHPTTMWGMVIKLK